jgi:hypothetical protein
MHPVLTHENHFKFGYDGDWFRPRRNPDEIFTAQYGRCQRQPQDFRSESINAARLIRDATTDPIYVLYSGGVDSEVAMLSFMAARIPIKAAIMRFDDDLNLHDIAYAVRFCQRNKVPYQFFDIDIIDFLNNRLMDYMGPVHCTSPMTAAVMWLVDQIDGYPVIGQGECLLLRPELQRPKRIKEARVASYQGKEFTDNDWALQESEMINAWYRHFLLRGREGVPGFHQYTPEQILCYIRDPGVLHMTQQNAVVTSESMKATIYRRHFDMAPRDKHTGYEKLATTINKQHSYLLSLHGSWHNIYLFDYELLKSDLQPIGTE